MEKWMENFTIDAYGEQSMVCDRCLVHVEWLSYKGTTLAELVLAAGGHVCKQNPVDN